MYKNNEGKIRAPGVETGADGMETQQELNCAESYRPQCEALRFYSCFAESPLTSLSKGYYALISALRFCSYLSF